MRLHSVPTYQEQLVSYKGVVILINLSNISVQAEYYIYYMGCTFIPQLQKMSRMTTVCCTIGIIYPHNLRYYFH